MDDNELREMVRCGVTLDGMSRMIGVAKANIVRRLAELRLDIPGKVPIDTLLLFRLWHDPRQTVCGIARVLGVRDRIVYRAAERYGLPKRTRIILGCAEDEAPDDEEAAASLDSLRLAPSVERLAAQIRAGWSESERYLRRVQRVQPVTYANEFAA